MKSRGLNFVSHSDSLLHEHTHIHTHTDLNIMTIVSAQGYEQNEYEQDEFMNERRNV